MKLGISGIILFVFSAILYGIWSLSNSGLVYEYGYPVSIVGAVVGFFVSWRSNVRWMSVVGAFGCIAVLVVAVLFPVLMSLIWKPIP